MKGFNKTKNNMKSKHTNEEEYNRYTVLEEEQQPLIYSCWTNLDEHPISNTDGSFTKANSNSFFSLHEILPIIQENIYLGKCS